MKKRIITYLLTITMLLGGFALPVHGAEAISEQDIQLTITDVGLGNICNNDTLSFTLALRNPELRSKTFTIDYTITDSDDGTIAQEAYTVPVAAKTVKFYPCSVPLPGYDVYRLNVMVEASDSEILVQRSEKFAYVKKNTGVSSDIGVSTQITNGYDDDAKTIPQMQDAGFGIVRDSIKWERADNGDGTYTVPAADMEWIDRANAAGMKVILLAWNGHSGYNDGSIPTSEDDLKEVTSYSAQIAEQLKGKIWAYEVWNEPNNVELSTNYHTTTGTEYAALLKAVYEGIRNVAGDKETPIIGGALTPLWETKQDTIAYLREMMAAGAGNYMDGFSFHPYSYDGGAYYDEGDPADNLDTQITYAESILADYNFNKGIYLTEVGASTHESTWGVTEWQQAVSLSRVATMAETDERIKATTYYTWLEKSTIPTEQKWGIVSVKYGNVKPAYAALSFRNHLLGGIENREKKEQGVYAYHQGNGGSIFALWSEKEKSEAFTIDRTGSSIGYNANTITCPEDYIVKVYDMYGNIIEGDTITVTEAPVYVSCMPKSEAAISAADGFVNVSGIVSDKEQPITVFAREAGGGEIAYVNQVYADAEGTYRVSFPVDENAITAVAVCDGAEKTEQSMSSTGMLDVRFYRGETEISSPDEVTDGTLSVKVKASSAEELIAFAAVFGSNGVLTSIDSGSVNNTSETNLNVTMEDGAEFKFMLWSKEMKPIINPIISK